MYASLYVDLETKKRLVRLKPERQTMVGFINTLADVWNGLTSEQRIEAINATKKEISE